MLDTAGTAINPGAGQKLKRDLGVWHNVRFGLLCMLPIAPTQVWGYVHQLSGGMVALVYIIAMIAMLFTALSYKAMVQEFPVAGSAYSYVQRGANKYIGFYAGWIIVLDYIVIPSLLTKFASTWAAEVFPNIPAVIIITTFLVIVGTMVYFNGKIYNWLNNFFLFGQYAFIAMILYKFFDFVVIQGNGAGGFSMAPLFDADAFAVVGIAGIAGALSQGMLGFIGFDTVATQAEETVNARKVIGRSVVLSLIIISLTFIVQGYMAALAFPDYAAVNPDTGYFDVIRLVAGDAFTNTFIMMAVFFVGIANVVPIMSSLPRVLRAMALDNTLPFSGFLSKLHPKHKTPSNAILFVIAISFLIVGLVSLDVLSALVSFGAMTTYFMLDLTVVYYFLVKKKERGLKAYFLHGLIPLMGAGVIGFIFTGFAPLTWAIGGAWIALGTILLVLRYKRFGEVAEIIE